MKRILNRFWLVALAGCLPASAWAATSGDDLAKRIKEAGDAKKYPGAACVVVYDNTLVTVRPNGLATTDQTRVVKVLTDAGIKQQAVQTFDFDPVTNRFQVKGIRVHRPDGTVEQIDCSNITTAPAAAWGIYWGSMFQTIALPRLNINDCVEVVTTRTGFNLAYLGANGTMAGPVVGAKELEPPMPGHWHDTAYFTEDYPIIEKRFRVRLPKDKPLQYEVCHGTLQSKVRLDGDHYEYIFVGKDMPTLDREQRMVYFSDAGVKLVLATVPDWVAKSKWFHDANVNQFEVTPEIQAKTDEIIAGIDDDIEKIRAINSWVADNIRYVGTTRGVCEGYTMHTGDETFRDRGGVCKDKAGMAVTMLRAAGFESFPVMTQALSDVEYTPADQFNHAVGVVRFDNGDLMLVDPTWSPQSREIWSSREAEQHVVYGLPEGHDLAKSPFFPPEHNKAVYTADSRIEPGGRLESQMHLELTGYPDTYFRRSYLRPTKPEQRGVVERAVRSIGHQASLVDLSMTDPWDYSQDMSVDAKVIVEEHAFGRDDTRLFRLPVCQHPFGDLFAPDVIEKYKEYPDRKYDVRMRASRMLKYKDSIQLPPGWTIEHLPEDVEIDNEAARLVFKTEKKKGKLDCTFEVVVKSHMVKADQYDGFYEVNKKLHELMDSWVLCSVNGTLASTATRGAEREEVAP